MQRDGGEMGKVISLGDLAKQQQLNFLEQKRREYREREVYLLRLRRLLFKIEAQMRQAEVLQMQILQDLAENLKTPLKFPNLGDRVGLQEFLATDPVLAALQEFLAAQLDAPECYQRIMELKRKLPKPPETGE
jgi:hypothetical protein